MPKPTYLLRLLALIFSLCCLIRSAAAAKAEDGLLWQVSKKGQPVSYLIGTMHLGKSGSTLPADFQAALNRSGVLVLETRVSPEYLQQHPQAVRQMLAHYDHPRPLRETVGSRRLAAARLIYADSPLKDLNILFQDEAQIAPWVLWFHFSYALMPAGYDLEHGIDLLLERSAQAQGKPVRALEADEALVMLKKLPEDLVLRGIDTALRHHRVLRRQNGNMLALYQTRRLNELWHLMQRPEYLAYGMGSADVRVIRRLFHDDLIVRRNRNWLPKITAMLPQGSHTIAVGAAHLPGPDGLIALLRREGYRVVPLNLP